MALWIERTVNVQGNAISGAKPAGMCGMAPRGDDMTASELVWRDFVLNVQRHDCYTKKCFTKRGEACAECKYGYPRRIFHDNDQLAAFPIELEEVCHDVKYNVTTDRYEVRADEPEDQRLSPYVPLWLLAWGASMNVQFCTSAGFLSYIAKYVTKPEPYGALADNDALRERENLSDKARFLTARIIGAPEAVYRCVRPPSLQLAAAVLSQCAILIKPLVNPSGAVRAAPAIISELHCTQVLRLPPPLGHRRRPPQHQPAREAKPRTRQGGKPQECTDAPRPGRRRRASLRGWQDLAVPESPALACGRPAHRAQPAGPDGAALAERALLRCPPRLLPHDVPRLPQQVRGQASEGQPNRFPQLCPALPDGHQMSLNVCGAKLETVSLCARSWASASRRVRRGAASTSPHSSTARRQSPTTATSSAATSPNPSRMSGACPIGMASSTSTRSCSSTGRSVTRRRR